MALQAIQETIAKLRKGQTRQGLAAKHEHESSVVEPGWAAVAQRHRLELLLLVQKIGGRKLLDWLEFFESREFGPADADGKISQDIGPAQH